MRPFLASMFVASSLILVGCPSETPPAQPSAPAQPAQPGGEHGAAPAAPTGPVTRVTAKDWCAEHGVPENVCTRCNASLIEGFKAKQDWCAGHNMPESQCIACNPEVEARWKAMAPEGTR